MSNTIYFTPGPSQLYFSVEQHLKNAMREDIPSISHRSSQFSHIFSETTSYIKSLLGLSDQYHIFFTSSATEVWERISQNLIEKHSYHFVNGSFADKFTQIARQNKLNVTINNPGFGKPFELTEISKENELISVTYNETSAGFQFDNTHLEQLRKKYPQALIALDVVSVAPAVPIDFNLVDTAYLSVQKCFGLPSGLGVWIVNRRALDKAANLTTQYQGSYHSLTSLLTSSKKNQTPETPNVLGIYLLGKVAHDMLQKGKEMMHRDTAYKSALLYQAVEENPNLSPFIQSSINRSKTVCIAKVKGKNHWLLQQFEKMGFILGEGYGEYKNDHIRIANFPTHSKEQVEYLSDLLKACRPN
ncbi:MAG: aminotransferase class V-fold PLP-dependent enzyme [Cyclobacteriaceae bacterium]